MKKKESKYTSIVKLVSQLTDVEKQAEALGIFLNDRDLIECPTCGLLEDVEINGKLITYFQDEKTKDIGLRFHEESTGLFRCPNCKNTIDILKNHD